ncbi:unnamed protein product [Amoebophrya sp. A25]|nr:unnamed protein product [Amoebophrya sp. A25]|eukprot:GSA25T00015692001.1
MDEASKKWLNVSHFDHLTAAVSDPRNGIWQRIETSIIANPSGADKSKETDQDSQQDELQAGTAAGSKEKDATSENPAEQQAKGVCASRVSTTSNSGEAASQSSSSSSTTTTKTAEDHGGEQPASSSSASPQLLPAKTNQNEIDITLHGIQDLSHCECLVFQNWYASKLSLYEVGLNRREKLILHDYRLVEHPSYETDQQSYFAIYRSQLDTTEFFSRPAGNRNIKLRARLIQESPVWGQCGLRHVTAYRFLAEKKPTASTSSSKGGSTGKTDAPGAGGSRSTGSITSGATSSAASSSSSSAASNASVAGGSEGGGALAARKEPHNVGTAAKGQDLVALTRRFRALHSECALSAGALPALLLYRSAADAGGSGNSSNTNNAPSKSTAGAPGGISINFSGPSAGGVGSTATSLIVDRPGSGNRDKSEQDDMMAERKAGEIWDVFLSTRHDWRK